MDAIIQVKNLKKTFGKLEVLKGVNCAFHGGNVVAVLGPNAAGKTTLIKSILGMVIPDSGEILFHGVPIANSFSYKKYLGYMPQISQYPDNMTIGQLFAVMKDIRQETQNLDTEMIEVYNLERMFHKTMRTLSGGTRQKVSAALAFMFNPEVLVLDEPTAGLDPLAAEYLKEKIKKEKAKGKLILITSHVMSEVDEIADLVMYLNEGQVQFYQSVASLKYQTGEEKLGKALKRVLV